ncbi:hypothetical protein HF669_00335 [Acidithiobacillus thiooxidans]|uniref:hypothetical protein n=2 Tax=Acidithiobacillus thiooxidans TaxID=930 RepID=UPI0002625118|nr:hypothetical protein [Acidithiobacillus thiooxidans]MBU2792681.1 hypothetical protein [Acidithiobacillus thiooxidans]MBU2809856.1 hypothetical protein [Acidithiobacillus thiooxidans]
MGNIKKKVSRLGFGFSILALAGCASAPAVMPESAQGQQYPTLQRALKNSDNTTRWGNNGQKDVILASVGPAPMVAASVGFDGSPSRFNAGEWAVTTGLSAAAIAFGAVASGVGGLFLGPSDTQHYPGLRDFQEGSCLYAVRLVKNKQDARRMIPEAATMAAKVPALFAGSVVGHTSWQHGGSVWEPHKMLWSGGTDSYEVVYQPNPDAATKELSPVGIFGTELRPLVHKYAITDQWQWAFYNVPVSQQEADSQKISKAYPRWIFVLARHKKDPLVCVGGTCKTAGAHSKKS